MGQSAVNAGTWSVMGSEHPNGREWGYSYHLGSTAGDSPAYTTRATRDAIIAGAQQSEAAWLAAMPTAVRSWVTQHSQAALDLWRAGDAAP